MTLIELPLVLPPAVAGIGLLAAVGPGGIFGPALDRAGLRLALETAGVVVALAFVASPFYVHQAQAAFGAIDPAWLDASRTLGAGEARTFLRIAIPSALPGLLAGTRLAAFTLDVALEVTQGGCLALAGPSGAGKTTLMRIVTGLLRPDFGRVSCEKRTWLDTERGIDLAPERRRCGYVFQDHALFEHLSAWQSVAYPLRGLSCSERRTRAHELLERFGMASLAGAHPRTLSGGERQRVAVARALTRRSEVLLLDEPLSALDPPHPRERQP